MTRRGCAIDGCERPFLARHWCTLHYQRWRATGDPLGLEDKSVPNGYDVVGGVGALIITRRDGSKRQSMYDLADHAFVVAHQWHIANGYVTRNLPGGRGRARPTRLHREVLGLRPGDEEIIDHINGNRLDNRKANLRIASTKLNSENRAILNGVGTSRYRGVCWDKSRQRWKAYTRMAGRMCNVGYFSTEQEAADAIVAYRTANGICPGY